MAGNITIILPAENFVKVPVGIVCNDTVDALALGVFVKVLELGREQAITIQGLADILDLSLAKVQKAFATIETAGYLHRSRVKDAAGRFVGWDYEISSEPLTDYPENRQSEKPTIGKTDCRKNGLSVDPSLIIINKDNIVSGNNTNTPVIDSNTPVLDYNNPSSTINTKREEKKETEERKEQKSSSSRFRKPTVQEVADYCRARQNDVDAIAFVAFYESKGWMVGRNPMKDWKQAVITWEQRKGRKSGKKDESLGDYYTNLLKDIKDFYGTDTPDEQ